MPESNSVIVTGAASGIGLAMTIGLIKAGHDVTAVDRNALALGELEKQARGLKGSVLTVVGDLSHPDSFAHVTGAALIKYGRIDALVNNAGIGQASVQTSGRWPIRFWETTSEQWNRFVAVNAAGPINMARAVLPHMLSAKRGTDRHSHDEPRHHGAGGLPALRLLKGGSRVGDGDLGRGPGR